MVDIMDKIQKVADIGKSVSEKQEIINVVEVFYIWDVLVTKLDALESIQIFEHMIEDNDLKIIKSKVKDGILKGIEDMEIIMRDYDLPFPMRPPADVSSIVYMESVKDRDIFQMFYEIIAAFFPVLGIGFMQSTTPDVRKSLKNHLLLTIELQEMLVEYGKLKGFLNHPPAYRTYN
ncbi:Protein of unknown function (DUF3231) [Desulfosporosinus acidiphilus SJ4]|uniref:DUF3231 family protein n=1 Tax=Desulfosporosinus acidiphilus (strain DSM 22704 / JCM 16185 / SJ4) TaxID=646529 RepID=I4D6K0_DESAJ|nr:DUF3231 family protein [Desulfosporosinus acidiphilus]AFM41424.1 Protein of unknown function (DUF3231) [Desulfosporosinus acidiphilus SJ4]